MQKIDMKNKTVQRILLVVLIIVLGVGAWLISDNISTSTPVGSIYHNKAPTSTQSQKSSTPSSTSKGLYPADSASATQCLGASSNPTAPVTFQATGPVPPCQKVKANQNLVIINPTSQSISGSFAGNNITITHHSSYQLTKPFGSYLAQGVHDLTFIPSGTAKIWLQ